MSDGMLGFMIDGQCRAFISAITPLYTSMGRVSGSSSLFSRLVGDLPRHEIIGGVEDPATMT